jgi:hypothetical protein
MTLPSQQPRQGPHTPILPPADECSRIAVGVQVRYGHRHVLPGIAGMLGFRSKPIGPPTLHLAFAQAWELMVPDHIYERASPIINQLADKTITRRKYKLLRALLIENALLTGQPDVTDHILAAIEQRWRRCPLRYLWF